MMRKSVALALTALAVVGTAVAVHLRGKKGSR